MKQINSNESAKYLAGFPVRLIFMAALITQVGVGLLIFFRISSATLIKQDILDIVAPLESGMMVGQILGAVFIGYLIVLFIAALTVDFIGMRRLHVLGIAISFLGVMLACFTNPDMPYAFRMLWSAFFLQGLGWGCIESSLHPLIVSLFPKEKVKRLCFLLGAYSLGMIVGAVVTWCVLDILQLGWKILLLIAFIPMIVALGIIARVKYPPSERVMHAVSYPQMAKNTFTRPMFYTILVLMILTGATENLLHFMDIAVSNITGFHGYWLIGFVQVVHLAIKLCAGPLNRKLGGSAGMMAASCTLACFGLIGLHYATGPVSAMAAAFLFGAGTALFWPTTVASVSERIPAGGTMAMGLVATAGLLSTAIALPLAGSIFDSVKVAVAGGAEAFELLAVNSAEYIAATTQGSRAVFKAAAFLPGLAAIAYIFVWLKDRRQHPAQ